MRSAGEIHEVDPQKPPRRPPTLTTVQLAALGVFLGLAVIDAISHDFKADRDWLVALVMLVFGAEVGHRWPRP